MTKQNPVVLTTIADSNHLEAVQQLFASAQHAGGFDGDFLLITSDISDEDKVRLENDGVIVWRRPPISTKQYHRWGPIFTLYLYLFGEEMTQWRNVVYLDVDCMVRSSIKGLNSLNGFYARSYYNYIVPQDIQGHKITSDFLFNPGVIVFSTDILAKNSFSDISDLYRKLEKELPPDSYDGALIELVLSIFTASFRKELPAAYNVIPNQFRKFLYYSDDEIDGIILHHAVGLPHAKPWDSSGVFFDEYQKNLKLFGKPGQVEAMIWPQEKIDQFEKEIIRRRKKSHRQEKLNRFLGRAGQAINSFSPQLYSFFKKIWKPKGKKF